MDRYYLQDLISQLERERAEHGTKFAGNPVHINCLPRFDNTIEKLKGELAKLPTPGQGSEPGSITARGDELHKAHELNEIAHSLKQQHEYCSAEALKKEVHTMVAKELNQIDGFDR